MQLPNPAAAADSGAGRDAAAGQGAMMTMIGSAERDELRLKIEAHIVNLCTQAKRKPRAIALFEADPPTAWDMAHRALDDPLDDWLIARG